MVNAISELSCLQTLLHELDIPLHPVTLSCDNEIALHIPKISGFFMNEQNILKLIAILFKIKFKRDNFEQHLSKTLLLTSHTTYKLMYRPKL